MSIALILASATISSLEGDLTLLVKNAIEPTIFFFFELLFLTVADVGCQ